ncbi:MAG TPA: phosphatase [Atribacter sp.]|jgi:putative hydrolase|uniref:phosphatase n=1 Tax=Atribacter sp. TaxID=2847780 RepID=UPI002BD2AC79|nr:phosphatase [Atribacter sp.]HQK82464.1 phosphatase [Atribacter sp.]
MYQIIGDLHIHSIVSGHAFSTVREIALVAQQKNLQFIGLAEHGPSMPGGPSPIYFEARGHFPKKIDNIEVFFGAEIDILDENSTLDLDSQSLKKIDYGIISFHPQVYRGEILSDYTSILIKALENPYINIIAHLGNPRYPVDYPLIVKKAIDYNKVIEINNSSFHISRKGSLENCKMIAQEIKKQGGYIIVTSDAHYCDEVGDYQLSLDLLESINFPKEYIINASPNMFQSFMNSFLKIRGRER